MQKLNNMIESIVDCVGDNKYITVLVTGATGLLGTSMVPVLVEHGYNVITHAHHQEAAFRANLSVKEECFTVLENVKPTVVINLIGLTSVELCEEQPNLAYKVNTQTVENIVDWILISKSECHLIHISTDQVYDGDGTKSEDEIVLKNMYAFSKYAAEIVATKVNSTVLRTNFFGKSKTSGRESITDWVYVNLKNARNIQVFDDVYFSPLSISTISHLMPLIIKKKASGIFNLGSNDGMTKADFDFLFAEKLFLPTESMKRINSSEFTSLKATRPKDMRMNCRKFEETFGIVLPELKHEIDKVVKEYSV
jgi:dTDP-4-dehydrorhamnose reductase